MKNLIETLPSAVGFVPKRLSFPGSWVGHIPFAAWLIEQLNPSTIVELGTHSGNSYLAMCQAVKENGLPTKCYAVDTWLGDEHSSNYGEEVFIDLSDYHSTHYGNFSSLLRTTFDEALKYFSDHTVDLLHIDGLHTYEAVKHDYESWLPKMAKNGIILFHDINVRKNSFGVWRLWDELSSIYPYKIEFHHSHGLGLIQISSENDGARLSFLEQDSIEKNQIIPFFSVLGTYVSDRYEKIQLEKSIKLHCQESQERAERLEKIVQEQSTELDVRLKAIEATDQARKDQQDRADMLEKSVTSCHRTIESLSEELSQMLRDEIRFLRKEETP